MSLTIPEGVVSNGHVPVYFVPSSPANLDTPSLATDLAEAVQLDCYLVGGGLTYNKTSSTRESFRLCMVNAATKPGPKTFTVSLQGVYDGQNTTPTENALFNSLKEAQTGTLYVAWGHESAEALAAGVVVDVISGVVGSVTKNSPVRDEDLTITVEFLGEQWSEDVAIVA